MEWIALLFFLFCLAIAVVAEVLWLVRNGWAERGKAAAYALTANLIGIGLGSMVIFVVFFITFMMAFGPAGTGSTAPESAYWTALIVGIILPLLLLVFSKRVFLSVLKIDHKNNAWAYSVVSSLLMLLIVFMPAPFFYYLINSIWTS